MFPLAALGAFAWIHFLFDGQMFFCGLIRLRSIIILMRCHFLRLPLNAVLYGWVYVRMPLRFIVSKTAINADI
jgi:hypothetical protein